MAFVPTPLVAKSVFEGIAAGVPIINTLWFKKDTPWSLPGLQALNTGLYNWWTSWFKLYSSSLYTLTQIVSYDMSSATGPKHTRPVGEVGSLAGTLGSFQDVLNIKFGTENRGRSGRGGNRISPIREVDMDDNVIGVGHRDNWLDVFDALNTAVQTAVPAAEHVLVSFTENGVPRLEGLAQLVDSYESVQQFVRTLKSRREP